MKRTLVIISVAVVVGAIAFVLGDMLSRPIDPRPRPVAIITEQTVAMGTIARITAFDEPGREGMVREIVLAALARISAIDKALSLYSPDSDISRANAGAAESPVEVGPIFLDCFERALEVSQATNGLFNPAVKPLSDAWGFGPGEEYRVPSDEELVALLPLCDLSAVKVEEGRISYGKPGMALDLNGIAQGFAADEAALILKAAGINSALIEVGGGEFVCVGGKPYNTPFNIGIRKPVRESEETLATLLVAHHAMATSGDYERYFEVDGVRYSHLIDPRTGRPKTVPSTSVTVVGPSCATCDSLGTACSLLSPEDAIRLISEIPGYEVLIAEKTSGEPVMHRSVGIYGDKGAFAHSASMDALKEPQK